MLQSAFMILLRTYSRQEDIIVGTVFAGRNHRDLENMAGMFVNTVAMRGYRAKVKTVRAFVEEMQQVYLEAEENQDYPFEELVETLGIRREVSRNPLFDVMFVLQNNEREDDRLMDAGISGLTDEHTVSKFDITLNAIATPTGYTFGAEYSDVLFTEFSVERLLTGY